MGRNRIMSVQKVGAFIMGAMVCPHHFPDAPFIRLREKVDTVGMTHNSHTSVTSDLSVFMKNLG
jgi:hypothetical protein